MATMRRRSDRSGAVLIVTLLMMVLMLIFVAMAVDLGYIQVAATEMQRSADASAIAAGWHLLSGMGPGGAGGSPTALTAVRNTASQFAGLNAVTSSPPSLAFEDATIGQLAYPFGQASFTFADPSQYNAVSVRVRRTAQQNGEISLFFSRIMGMSSLGLDVDATAAFCNNFRGFRTPSSGENSDFLPFALDKETWDNLIQNGVGTDDYKFDPVTQTVVSGSDGIKEVNLYPQGTGSPGNRGTVDVGSSNNSTADISRQIRYGVSQADLAYHGGKLELDASGQLILNGDTGISAGIKDDLASIIGKPKAIFIFSQVQGPGNNAMYTIVDFAGVRVLNVKLTGSMSSKNVMIQPAGTIMKGGIPATDGIVHSQYIYSPVVLVR